MTAHYQAMVLASFVADSLALGAHWIYDTKIIDNTLGRVDQLRAPLADSYHAGKKKGAFTHYGDQSLLLLTSLSQTGAFNLQAWYQAWGKMFTTYAGYRDKASTTTLERITQGLPPEECGSQSSDLGGAARMAPLLYLLRQDREALLQAVRQQTALTHNNPTTLAGAEFLTKSTWNILHGVPPREAMEQALAEGINDLDLDIRIRSGLDSAGKTSRTVIKDFGQMCGMAAALPGVIHLVSSYPHNLEQALIENVMAGGDSAARGMAVGMMLGAHLGLEALPPSWCKELVRYDYIKGLLKSITPPQ